MHHVSSHPGRIAQQHVHGHVDRTIIEFAIIDDKLAIVGQRTNDGNRATFSLAQRRKLIDTIVTDEQHVALLRFVTPNVHRRHARLGVCDFTQFYLRAAFAVIDCFGHRVREPASAHVMDKQNRVVSAHLPATIDDFLCPPLHLRVAALHRCKIKVFAARTACKA